MPVAPPEALRPRPAPQRMDSARGWARADTVFLAIVWACIITIGLVMLDREMAVRGKQSVLWSHLRKGD